MNCPECGTKVYIVMRELGQDRSFFGPCGHEREKKDVQERPHPPAVGDREER